MLPLRAAFFLFHGSVKKLFLQQTVDILRQAFTVVEGHILRNRKIGYGPLIDVIEGSVLDKGQTRKAGDLESGTAGRGHRKNNTAPAARGASDDRDLIAVLENTGHKVPTGEADRRGETVDIFCGKALILLTVLMIKVQINVINRSCHRPGHWIQRADGPVAQNGRDYKDRRVGSSAGVAAEIDDHIFHGAVLAHDLLIGIEHDTDGVFCLLGRRCFVIIDPRRDAGKVIEGNIGRIADLFLWKDKLT